MKTFPFLSVVVLGLVSVFADERSAMVTGVCHQIMMEPGAVLFFPLNTGLSKEKAPYFISIEVAETEDDLKDPTKCILITQGIPLDVDSPYPIGLRLKEGKTQYYKVTAFTDACFTTWRRSQVYSINSQGILALPSEQTEQTAAGQPATRSDAK